MARSSTATASPSQHHHHHLHTHQPFRHPARSAPTSAISDSLPIGAGAGAAAFAAEHFPAIPGFRTSAAFLSSLGANLRIPDADLLPSPLHTPSLRPSREGLTAFVAPPSPLTRALLAAADDSALAYLPPAAMASSSSELVAPATQPAGAPSTDPLADVPELSTYAAKDDTDIIPALKLIADSIAQQRQTASRVLISHPANIAVVIGFFSIVFNYLYNNGYDNITTFTTLGGLAMACLAAVRYSTREYIFAAESLKYDWIAEDDTVLVTKFGNEIIGTCVVGWEGSSPSAGSKKRGSRNNGNVKGIVRAWTVRLRYRGKGVGRALLEEAVNVVYSKGGDELVAAQDHANSARFLPSFYNRLFDKRDARAAATIAEVVEEKRALVSGGSLGKKR